MKQQFLHFETDPGNPFHAFLAEVWDDLDTGTKELFVFHQLRESEDGLISEAAQKKTRPRGKVFDFGAAKIVKGEKKGYETGILYLAPGNSSGVEVCQNRSGKCPTFMHEKYRDSNIIFGVPNRFGTCASDSGKDARFFLSDPDMASDDLKKIVDEINGMKPMRGLDYLSKLGFIRDVGCSGLCLGHTSGHGCVSKEKMDDIENHFIHKTRIERTKNLLARGEEANKKFLDAIDKDIQTLIRHAKREGTTPTVRLNGTSDIFWHLDKRLKKEGKTFFELYPHIQFYDYTKNMKEMIDFIHGRLPENYHLTFSFAGDNWPSSRRVLDSGGNVAVAFRLRKEDDFPLTWRGYNVIDGDETDLRFLDRQSKPGNIVGLRTKGRSYIMRSLFIVEPDDPDLVWPEGHPFADASSARKVVDGEIEKREKGAAKNAFKTKFVDDLKAVFPLVENGKLTKEQIKKAFGVRIPDFNKPYNAWLKNKAMTTAGKKSQLKKMGVAASNINSMASRVATAMANSGYVPSNRLKGDALADYIANYNKKTVEESFIDFFERFGG